MRRVFPRAVLASIVGCTIIPGVLAAQVEIWDTDPAHSVLDFTVRLVGFNRVRGSFPEYRAAVTFDAAHPEQASITLVIQAASVETGTRERDDHLRGGDFFDTGRFPHILFESERIEPRDSGFVAIGRLTIRDSSQRIEVPISFLAPPGPDPFGNRRFAVEGRITLSRRAFGVAGPRFWNNAISDGVAVEFELALRRWGYRGMGWGSPRRTSIGRRMVEVIESQHVPAALSEARRLWGVHARDTTWNFGLFEFEKVAGRLTDDRRYADAAAVLELALSLRGDAEPVRRAVTAALLAEVRWRGGESAAAARAASEALRLDPMEPRAREIARRLRL